MDDLIVAGQTLDATTLYITELSEFTLRENGISEAPSGLYLCEESDQIPSSGIRVLAQVPDLGAAYRLLDLIFGSPLNPSCDKAPAV